MLRSSFLFALLCCGLFQQEALGQSTTKDPYPSSSEDSPEKQYLRSCQEKHLEIKLFLDILNILFTFEENLNRQKHPSDSLKRVSKNLTIIKNLKIKINFLDIVSKLEEKINEQSNNFEHLEKQGHAEKNKPLIQAMKETAKEAAKKLDNFKNMLDKNDGLKTEISNSYESTSD